MSELPRTWRVSTVGELNQFAGRTVDPKVTPHIDYELFSVPIFPTRRPEIVQGKDIGSTKQSVEPGDVLVCKINPRINRVWVVGPKGPRPQIASSEWISVRVPSFDTRFLREYFSSPEFRQLIEEGVSGVGGSLTRAQPKRVAAFPVPVAPRKEQRRIADKLDAVLAKVEGCRERLDRVPQILKRFREAVLAAGYTGRLTADYRARAKLSDVTAALAEVERPPRPNRYKSRTLRVLKGSYALAVGDPEAPVVPGWPWIPLVDVARMESGHTPSRSHPEYWGGIVPWMSIPDGRDWHGKTIPETYQHTNEKGLANSAARILPQGTVCLSRTASVGYVVRMGKPMSTSQDFVNWTCTPVLEPDFLKYLLMAEGDGIRRFGEGTTHTTIYFPELLAFHIALPPIEEQRELVRRVDELLGLADSLERRYEDAVSAVAKLTPSVLAKAFRGELVPQDPNDAPAEKMLERVRGERTAGQKQRRKVGAKVPR